MLTAWYTHCLQFLQLSFCFLCLNVFLTDGLGFFKKYFSRCFFVDVALLQVAGKDCLAVRHSSGPKQSLPLSSLESLISFAATFAGSSLFP